MAIDFQKLKELAKSLGGILIMEGNNPEFVVLSYDAYESMSSPKIAQPAEHSVVATLTTSESEQAVIETLNQEIAVLKEEIRQKETE